MRDKRGRYTETKKLEDIAPPWAQGCFECTYGLVNPTPIPKGLALAMVRLVQAIDGTLVFCTCKAGQRYRVNLLNLRQWLIDEAKASKNMAWIPGSHPEIEGTRRRMQQAASETVPTMHFEETK